MSACGMRTGGTRERVTCRPPPKRSRCPAERTLRVHRRQRLARAQARPRLSGRRRAQPASPALRLRCAWLAGVEADAHADATNTADYADHATGNQRLEEGTGPQGTRPSSFGCSPNADGVSTPASSRRPRSRSPKQPGASAVGGGRLSTVPHPSCTRAPLGKQVRYYRLTTRWDPLTAVLVPAAGLTRRSWKSTLASP